MANSGQCKLRVYNLWKFAYFRYIYGPDDVIENCFSAWAEHFSDLSFSDLKFWECGDTVFAESNVVGGGLPSGGVSEMHRITIENSKIVEFHDYFDSAPYTAMLEHQ